VVAHPASDELKVGSNLEKVLRSGHFAVCGEMAPPQTCNGDFLRRKIDIFKGNVDACNLTDNQMAIVRMCSIAAARIILDEGLEPIIQMTVRDRNRIAIQADLLGAAGLGIRNVLCISGDHMSFGNHPSAKAVYDLDSLQLVHLVRQMREECMLVSGEGTPPKPSKPDAPWNKVPTSLFAGAASNPFGDPAEFRVVRLAKKVAAGADFIQTQAIYDIPRLEQFMSQVRDRGLHEKVFIIGGVLPVRSPRALTYMRDEVPGMSIPEELVQRMESAEDREEEGINICVELIEQIRGIEGMAGVHIMPPMWEKVVPEVVSRAGLLPRPTFEDSGE
jgi:methylenetetrahydrofolate reductase (NADPH)